MQRSSSKDSSGGGETELDIDPIYVDIYCTPAIKNAVDDVVKEIIETYGFEENHWFTDLKLCMCLVGSIFAVVGILYGFFVPFPLCKPVLSFCVLAYFVTTISLTLLVLFYEKDIIMFATRSGRELIADDMEISTIFPRYTDQFTIHMKLTARGGDSVEGSFTKSVGSWIEETGLLNQEKLGEDLLKLVQKLDKKNL
eukprot:Nk52_evm3s370 gene=Nk52_evmTU3s370